MGKFNRWRRLRVRFRRALAPLRPVTDLLQGPGEGERTRGFGLIEVAIAMAASAVIFSAIYSTVTAASESDHGLRVRVDLQLDAARVLKEITDVLKSSEPLDVWDDGASMPAPYANAAALSRARTPEE